MRSVQKKTTYVLDSWAVLALLQNEPSADVVAEILKQAQSGQSVCAMSVVNLGEVYYILARSYTEEKASTAVTWLGMTGIRFMDANRERAIAAAAVKAVHPLAYADAFAVGCAQELEGTLVTGDPEILSLGEAVSLLDLRKASPG